MSRGFYGSCLGKTARNTDFTGCCKRDYLPPSSNNNTTGFFICDPLRGPMPTHLAVFSASWQAAMQVDAALSHVYEEPTQRPISSAHCCLHAAPAMFLG